MAYFLRKEKKKKGTYLQMYKSFWDKDKKQPRTRNYQETGPLTKRLKNWLVLVTLMPSI